MNVAWTPSTMVIYPPNFDSFGGMNIHLQALLMLPRAQGSDPHPYPFNSRGIPQTCFLNVKKKTNFLFFAGSTLFTNKPYSVFAGYGLELVHTHCKNLSVYVYCFPKEVPQHPTPASVSQICRHPVLSFVCLTDICHDQKLDSISKLINPSGVLYIYVPILFGFPLRNGWPWTMFWPWHIDVTICSSLIPCVRCSCVSFY